MTETTPRTRDRSRRFDIVLFGATGFTGQLVAEYLAEHTRDTDLRWAIAGRNPAKLERVRDSLLAINSALDELPILVGDSTDRASLDAIASQTEVVCTTVGPYARYGSDLVASCVAHGTDYCDLTGEVQWIRRIVDTHHEAATRTGARIVHCCGFDSIPSDLGTLMLQDYMERTHGKTCDRVHFLVGRSSGGFSGGTVASMINIMEEIGRDRSVLRIVGNPYALNPEGERRGPDGSDQRGMQYDSVAQVWTAPFVMAAINTRIVRRSNALMDYRYSTDFRYREVMSFPDSPKGALMAAVVTAGLTAFTMGLAIPFTRKLLQRHVLPAPGEGPTREQIENGSFEIRLIGEGTDGSGTARKLMGNVVGVRDPGYGETAKMLSESALCLALQGQELDSPGGVLTPATAMGMTLVERLREAGMTFDVREA